VITFNLFVLPDVLLVDNHSILGQTELPQSLTSLLSLALNGAHIPDVSRTSVVLEILRVGANFCMDHGQQALDLLNTPVLIIYIER
jgi:hypothetical protein